MDISFFLFYSLIITITPGPTNLVILSTVHNNGVKKAMKFCYGAVISFGIILFLSVFLNSILTKTLPDILFYMQIIGSVYIFYLAYLIYNMNVLVNDNKEFGNFKIGFIMQFVNPKVIIFALTAFPSFVMPYYSSIYEQILIALIVTIIGGISFFSWVIFGNILKRFLQKYQKKVNTVMALFLVYCGYMILKIEAF